MAAFKKRRPPVAVDFPFSLLLSTVLTWLVAYLLSTASVLHCSPRNVTYGFDFDEQGLGARTVLQNFFGLAAAARFYQGTLPPWTALEYSFRNFAAPHLPSGPSGTRLSSSFSVTTESLSAGLDCVVLNASQYTEIENGNGLQISDRGCNFTTPGVILISSSTHYFVDFLQMFGTVGCDLAGGTSRLAVIAGGNFYGSNTTLTNTSVLSCRTAYYQTSSVLNVTYDSRSTSTPTVTEYTVSKRTTLYPRPICWSDFETSISAASTFDATATVSPTDFGRLILELAQQIDPDNYLDSEVIRNATQSMFVTVYATMMATENLYRAVPPRQSRGVLSVYTVRLLVIQPIASAVLAFLVCVVFILISYVHYYRSTLFEDPGIIMGAAQILRRNHFIEKEIKDARGESSDGKVWETLKASAASQPDGWVYADWDDPTTSRLLRRAKRQPAYGDTFRRNWKG